MPSQRVTTNSQDKKSILAENVDFEKARFDYCVHLYEEEEQRKEILEKKAQFYLSFITLFWGALFFNLQFLENLQAVILKTKFSILLDRLMLTLLTILFISSFVALIAILRSMQLQSYKKSYSRNLTSLLFSPGTKYFKERTEASLLEVVALDYTIALEINQNINNKKVKLIQISAYAILLSVISLAMVLTIKIVLFIY